MEYVVVLCDGMADYPVPALGGKTPMMVAKKPHIDALAAKADSNGNNIGDYTVKVKKATLCKDYLGNDAVKVVYSFTNNSKDAISFDVACTDEVYQDGIQLETTVLSNDETDLLDVKIKPGVTKDVTKAYKLSDSKTDLTVEVGQLLSFDDTKVTTTVKLSK